MKATAVPFCKLFRNDSDSLITLRLMAAANDLRSSVRLGKAALSNLEEGTHFAQSSAKGDMIYGFRMAAIHAFEAYRVATETGDLHHFFESRRGRFGDPFADQHRVLGREFWRDDLVGVLKRIRDGAGAHYFLDVFANALAAHDSVEVVTFHSSAPDQQHFDAGDEIYWRILAPELAALFPGEEPLKAVGLGMRRLASMQVQITQLATQMVRALYEERILGG